METVALGILALSCLGCLYLGYKYAKAIKSFQDSQAMVLALRKGLAAMQKVSENDRHLRERLDDLAQASADGDLNRMYAAATRIVSDRSP